MDERVSVQGDVALGYFVDALLQASLGAFGREAAELRKVEVLLSLAAVLREEAAKWLDFPIQRRARGVTAGSLVEQAEGSFDGGEATAWTSAGQASEVARVRAASDWLARSRLSDRDHSRWSGSVSRGDTAEPR